MRRGAMRRGHRSLATGIVAIIAAVSALVATLAMTFLHKQRPIPMNEYETAVFGGGCFWCIEAVFETVDGVIDVTSGYAGGTVPDPTYEQVCTGETGHAEVVRITFDPSRVSYADLLELFWKSHDPTTPNRQGPDEGTQYRSVIFTTSEEQRRAAEQSKRKAQAMFHDEIVTEILPLKAFYPAEAYHQDYFRRNPNAAYCRLVIRPKVDKLKHR
ncbi:MAG: peptide-methionine (S)-S-oxide reductase MsrA [Bacteroidota bacterium]|nr:peptide-methionine (S)-S-oxide reductase MsrA [Bacteroidota bacterium]